jgi:hypothetical protein
MKRYDIILFLFGLGSLFQVQLIGYISLSELAITVVGPFVIARNIQKFEHKTLRIFALLWLVWFLSSILTDFYRGSQFQFMARGIARTGLTGLIFMTLYFFFLENPKSIRWFLLGAALSTIGSYYIFSPGTIDAVQALGEEFGGDFTTKYNYWVTAIWAWLLSAFFPRAPYFFGFATILLGLAYIPLGSRSSGAIMALSGIVMMLLTHMRATTGEVVISWPRYFRLIFVAGIAAVAVIGFYRFCAHQGWLGERGQRKFEKQSQSQMGMILGGRPEVLSAMLAVKDSPIIGYGSWPEDRNGYRLRAIELLGFQVSKSPADAQTWQYIPSHSALFGSWVEQGIFGAAFWIAVLAYMVKFSRLYLNAYPPLLGYLTFILVYYSWAILFSPAGFRVPLGASLALFFAMGTLKHRLVMQSFHRANRERLAFETGVPSGFLGRQ